MLIIPDYILKDYNVEQIKQEELKLIEPEKLAVVVIPKTDDWPDKLNNKLEQIRKDGINDERTGSNPIEGG